MVLNKEVREKFEGKNEKQKSVFVLKWRRRRIFYSMSRITKHKFYDQNFLLKDPNTEKKEMGNRKDGEKVLRSFES